MRGQDRCERITTKRRRLNVARLSGNKQGWSTIQLAVRRGGWTKTLQCDTLDDVVGGIVWSRQKVLICAVPASRALLFMQAEVGDMQARAADVAACGGGLRLT